MNHRLLWPPLVAALALLALHARTLDHGFVWMDETEIVAGGIRLGDEPWTAAFTRPLHQTVGFEVAGSNPYYRPLQILAATAVYRVAGASPRAYRALSLALGALTAAAFAALASWLLGRGDLGLLAALLAVAHPAGIESWVWVAGLAGSLAALFVLASVGLGLRCAQGRMTRPRLRLVALLSLVALVVALLAKEKAVVVPGLLLVGVIALARMQDDSQTRRGISVRGVMLIAAQLLIVALYLLVWRPAVLGSVAGRAAWIGGDAVTHVLSALATWPASLAWLFVPLHSTTSDVVRVVESAAEPRVWLGAGLALGSLAAWIALLRAGRGVASLGLAWIWIAFLPTANLFPQLHARAERYLFLSTFGMALLVVDLLPALWSSLDEPWRRVGVAALGLLMVVGLAQRSWTRAPDWQSTRTLFERDVARDPDFREGRFHLARALSGEGRHAQAAEHLRALRERLADPGGTSGYVNEIGAYQLSCANALAMSQPGTALALLDEARARVPGDADAAPLLACRGQALEAQRRWQAALAVYQRVVEQVVGEPPAAISLSLAHCYARLGRRGEALPWLERARPAARSDPAFDFRLRQVERLLR